jgi:hypothetical protein
VRVAVVIPWLGGCRYRTRALGFVTSQLRHPFTVAHGCEPWVKAHAVYPALVQSDADIVAVHDADVWCDGLDAAIEAVADGEPWAKPHRHVHRLSKKGTEAFYGGADWRSQKLDRPVYRGMAGGGIVVARRETLLDVPLDPRFVGWGQEDESWALALHTLAGSAWLGTADLIHLWHPPQKRLTQRKGSRDGWALMKRYAAARKKPEEMRRILEEIHAAQPHQPTV